MSKSQKNKEYKKGYSFFPKIAPWMSNPSRAYEARIFVALHLEEETGKD